MAYTAKVGLAHGIALLRRQAEPIHCLGIILGNALTGEVHGAEVVLSRGVTLLGSQAVPLHRLGVVFRHPVTPVVHPAEVGLGIGVARWQKIRIAVIPDEGSTNTATTMLIDGRNRRESQTALT